VIGLSASLRSASEKYRDGQGRYFQVGATHRQTPLPFSSVEKNLVPLSDFPGTHFFLNARALGGSKRNSILHCIETIK
jgi:hypothetical protein